MNAPSTYRYPLYVLADDDYVAQGALTVEFVGDTEVPLHKLTTRYIGHDTFGRVLFDRRDHAGAKEAAKRIGFRLVSTAWYGVPTGLSR